MGKKIALLLIMALFTVPCFAETIVLKSGDTYDAEITEKTDKYISVNYTENSYTEVMRFKLSDVESIGGKKVLSPSKESITNAEKLADIPDDQWAKVIVQRSVEIMGGGAKFQGYSLLTRYEEAIVISELLNKYGKEIKAKDGILEFQILDILPSHPAYGAILVSINSGVLGTYDNKFHGENNINRFQIAIVLKKLMDVIGIDHGNSEEIKIKDVKSSHWAYSAMQIVVGNGVMKLEEGNFNGDELVTRHDEIDFIDGMLNAIRKSKRSSADEEVAFPSGEENNFETAVETNNSKESMSSIGDSLTDLFINSFPNNK